MEAGGGRILWSEWAEGVAGGREQRDSGQTWRGGGHKNRPQISRYRPNVMEELEPVNK